MYKYYDDKGQHLHTLDDKPLIGTSTVTQIIAKPLTWWSAGLAVKEFGWTNSKETSKEVRLEASRKMHEEIRGMEDEEYLSLLDKAYSAHSKSLKTSAVKGTDMHEELERYVKYCINNFGGIPQIMSEGLNEYVVAFSKWSVENIQKFLVSEGHCYSRILWCGGITDVIAEMKGGKVAIIDFKSSKEAYDSQFIQCAGYDIEQQDSGIVDKDGSVMLGPQQIMMYIVIPFGAPTFNPQIETNVGAYREGFISALKLHKLINIKQP